VCTVCRASTGRRWGLVAASGPHRGGQGASTSSGQWPLYFLEAVPWFLVRSCSTWSAKPPIRTLPHKNELRHPRIDTASAQNKGTGSAGIEVLDPLLSACKAFSQRLAASDLGRDRPYRRCCSARQDCNWMVNGVAASRSCAVSEACCARARSPALCWSGPLPTSPSCWPGARGQDRCTPSSNRNSRPGHLSGLPLVRTRLNRSLRWVVSNSLPVLTPQLFVRNRKIRRGY